MSLELFSVLHGHTRVTERQSTCTHEHRQELVTSSLCYCLPLETQCHTVWHQSAYMKMRCGVWNLYFSWAQASIRASQSLQRWSLMESRLLLSDTCFVKAKPKVKPFWSVKKFQCFSWWSICVTLDLIEEKTIMCVPVHIRYNRQHIKGQHHGQDTPMPEKSAELPCLPADFENLYEKLLILTLLD